MSRIEDLLNEAKIAIRDGNFETALANCLALLETQSTHPEALKLDFPRNCRQTQASI
jgi:uncharacterized protein HemY